jgi:NADPH2:quinone reductase
MKAAVFKAFGSAKEVLTLIETDKPIAAAGEVLVRLHASGINPSDTKKRAGAFPHLLADGPVIPNSDGAGVIESVGPGVPQTRIGQRVWVYQAQFGRRFGTAAQYVSLDAHRAIPLPDGVDFATGAAIGIPAMTAHRCVHADGPVDGKTVLVTGGAGRVGYLAIQFAKRGGATVVATASNPASITECLRAGADHVVNHKDADWPQQALALLGGRKVDRVVESEFGANLSAVLDTLQTGGVIATYSSMVDPEPKLPFRRMMFMDLTLRMVIVYAMPEAAKQHAIADITAALNQGQLHVRLGAQFALEDIAAASDLIDAAQVRGAVILDIA